MAPLLFAAACSPGGIGSNGPAPSPQDAHQAARLADINPQPRDALERGTLTLPIDGLNSQWNPEHADGNDADTGYIATATDPVLFDYAPDGTVRPRPEFLTALPTHIERNGQQVISYQLNPRARWNDGTPIDYRSFISSWTAHRAPYPSGPYQNVTTAGFEDIESITGKGTEVTVTMRRGHPFYPVTELFTTLLHPAVGADPKVFNNAFTGTNFHPEWRAGPFTLDTIDPTAKTIALKANPNWWGRPPILRRIVFREMDDPARTPAFANGEIDAVPVSDANRYAQIASVADADIRRSQRLSTAVLVFNGKAEPLREIAVRRALTQAVDRQEWNRIRFEGLNWSEPPVNSLLYFSFQPVARDNLAVGYDPAGARATLEAAGFLRGPDGIYTRNGKRLTIAYSSFGDDTMSNALNRALQRQASAVGIDLQINTRPAHTLFDAMSRHDYTVLLLGMQATTPDPVTSVCQLMCSDTPVNPTGLGTPALDRRIRSLGNLADPATQTQEVNDIERAWLRLYPGVPLANGPDIWAYRTGLANLGPAAFAGLQPAWEDVGWERGSRHG